MKPLLFEIGELRFHSYPVMLAVAFLSCTLLAVREAHRQDPPIPLTPQGGLWAYLGGLFGAKLFYAIQFGWPLWRSFVLWEGGLVFYGGLIGASAAVAAYLWAARLPRLRTGDAAIPYVALAQAITRVGCFLNGCCWGDVCGLPWAVTFPGGSYAYDSQRAEGLLDSSASLSLPVHPTQLYMVLGLIGVFFILKYALKTKKFDGAVLLLYLFLYGALRFTVEHFRADSARSVLGMTVSQTISLVLAVAGLAAYGSISLMRERRVANRAAAEPDLGTAEPKVAEFAGTGPRHQEGPADHLEGK